MPLPGFAVFHFLFEAAATQLMPGAAASILRILLRFHPCNAISMALLTDFHCSLVRVTVIFSASLAGMTSTQ